MGTDQLERMFSICDKAFPNETGGLLLGHYTPSLDCAIITTVCGPPEDSGAGRNWFRRGTKGLKAMLSKSWKSGVYYVGEWHAHPGGGATPSPTDRSQMLHVATNGNFECKVPLLIIVGGAPGKYRLRTIVFRESVEQGNELIQV